MANQFQKDYSLKGCKIDKEGATRFCIPSTKTVTKGKAYPSLGGLVPKYDPKRAIQNDLLCYEVTCRESAVPEYQRVLDQFNPKNKKKISSRKLKVRYQNIEICTPAWKVDKNGDIILINEKKNQCDWVKFDDKQDLFEVALSPDGVIGDGSDKKCKIFDSRNCKTCACDYYVRYSEDNGASWLGMSFEGVPGLGGTGCPAGGVGTTTVEQTIDFLQEYYIDEGYCGCSGKNVCLDIGCSKLKEGECMDSKKCITDLSMSKGYACRKDLCKGIDCTCKFKTNIKENQNLIKDVKILTPKCIDVGCKNLKEGECMASNDCISYTSMFKDYACGKELCDGSDCVCKYKSPSFEGSDKKNKEKVSTKKMVATKVKGDKD